MKTHASATVLRSRLRSAAPFVLCAALGAWCRAQTGPATRSSPGASDTVTLNPFEVKADSDRSYGAINANSITAFNLPIDRLPVTADILNQKFMDEMGAINVEAALQTYDAGTQFGGLNSANAAQNQPGDHLANGSLRLRGSPIGGMQINGLLIAGSVGNPGATSFGSTSNFYLERVEVINGPQSLLFAGGGAGGVINLVTKQARIGQPASGSFGYRIDQYGSKYGTFDYGLSRGKLAVRVALVSGTDRTRRVNVGHTLNGQYLQVAGELGNTVLRLSLQQSSDHRVTQTYHVITSNAGDALFRFNQYHLEYLLATGQAGAIDNGHLTWDNVQSYSGQWAGDNEVAEFASLEAGSKWSNWLSTRVSLAGGNFNDDQAGGSSTINFYTPAASSNPLPGNWTVGMPQSGFPVADQWRPKHNKAIRFTALLTNEFFGGRVKSQTNLGADYTGNYNAIIPYSFYRADGNFAPIVTPGQTANLGRTVIPTQAWTVNDGPVLYALFNPGVHRVTIGGVNYVREKQNTGSGTNGDFTAGYVAVNHSEWLDGKLDTLAGLRVTHQKAWTGSQVPSEIARKPNFSGGANYHLLPWLTPYVLVSDVWATAAAQNRQPDGTLPSICHAIGEEAGFKLNSVNGRLSGSISAYRNDAKDMQFNGGGNLASFVAPNGLNGPLADGTGANFTSNIKTYGLTSALTAAPTESWRMRLSAALTRGEFGKGVGFGQLYQDQFYANAAGQVTYADGTVVMVPATFNANTLTVPAGTAGAVPLTVTLLSTPGSQYFAAPQPVSGAILKTSNGGRVLLSPADRVHGSILTGKVGLPISAYQLNTALTGVTPPGVLYAVLPGNQTWGYPKFALNFTNVYEFSQGWLRGFKLGGTAAASWRNLAMYYYPNGFGGANFSDQRPFQLPMLTRFDLIAGYGRKFGRYRWSSQINISNLFNHYHVVIYPNVQTGWTNLPGLTANLDQQPRYLSWTNTISF